MRLNNQSSLVNVGKDVATAFGFGLSYTTFQLSHLVVGRANASASDLEHSTVRVTVDVKNTGNRQGAEVVQVCVAHPPANGEPPHQLRAFAKVSLKPGETRALTLGLDKDSFPTYDPAEHAWKARQGDYQILAGASPRDLKTCARLAGTNLAAESGVTHRGLLRRHPTRRELGS